MHIMGRVGGGDAVDKGFGHGVLLKGAA